MRRDLLRRAVWELSPLWGLVLVIAMAFATFVYNGSVRQYLNKRPFDSEQWKQASSHDRYDLAWDLLHGRLDGLSTTEVREILGDTEDKWIDTNCQDWWYDLGIERYGSGLFCFEVTRLIITFENDRVVRVSKTEH